MTEPRGKTTAPLTARQRIDRYMAQNLEVGRKLLTVAQERQVRRVQDREVNRHRKVRA